MFTKLGMLVFEFLFYKVFLKLDRSYPWEKFHLKPSTLEDVILEADLNLFHRSLRLCLHVTEPGVVHFI
jgi:hypothetical protein